MPKFVMKAPTLGKKLTGLAKSQMNALSSVELFGLLPFDCRRSILLDFNIKVGGADKTQRAIRGKFLIYENYIVGRMIKFHIYSMGDEYIDGYAIPACDKYQIQSFEKQHVVLKCIESNPNASRVLMTNPQPTNKSYGARVKELNRIMNTKQDQILRVTNKTFLTNNCSKGFRHENRAHAALRDYMDWR